MINYTIPVLMVFLPLYKYQGVLFYIGLVTRAQEDGL